MNYIKNLSINEIVAFLQNASNEYYTSGNSYITDDEYDEIYDYLKQLDPTNDFFKTIGSEIIRDAKLPIYMGSMNKIKQEEDIIKWINKGYIGPYIVSDKLDGISCLYDGKNNRLYKRGDGFYGSDITHLLAYINFKPNKCKCMIRGELIISKQNYRDNFKSVTSARHIVAGLTNSKNLDIDGLKYVDFVTYELINADMIPSEQLDWLKSHNFKVVYNRVSDIISEDFLRELLIKRKSESDYVIDGLIITDNNMHGYVIGENPPYSFAYKFNDISNGKVTKVVDIEWSISKDGYLKPIVIIEPVEIDGDIIRRATGINAKFIVVNNIGIGTIIRIIKSNDVIPKIVEIIKPSPAPLLPYDDYYWSDSGFDIILKTTNSSHQISQIVHFFTNINATGIGKGIINILFSNGYNTVKKILDIKYDDLLKISGFGDKSAAKLINIISDAISSASLLQIMIASNVFGRGLSYKKLDLILQTYQDIFDKPYTTNELMEIQTIGEINAAQFISNKHKFIQFLHDNGLYYKLNSSSSGASSGASSGILTGLYIVFSGFRDKTLQEFIINNGGNVNDTITKLTNLLIVKDTNKMSGKILYANKNNIKIISRDNFINSMGLSS